MRYEEKGGNVMCSIYSERLACDWATWQSRAISVRIEADVFHMLNNYCEAKDVSRNRIINLAIEEYLKMHSITL